MDTRRIMPVLVAVIVLAIAGAVVWLAVRGVGESGGSGSVGSNNGTVESGEAGVDGSLGASHRGESGGTGSTGEALAGRQGSTSDGEAGLERSDRRSGKADGAVQGPAADGIAANDTEGTDEEFYSPPDFRQIDFTMDIVCSIGGVAYADTDAAYRAHSAAFDDGIWHESFARFGLKGANLVIEFGGRRQALGIESRKHGFKTHITRFDLPYSPEGDQIWQSCFLQFTASADIGKLPVLRLESGDKGADSPLWKRHFGGPLKVESIAAGGKTNAGGDVVKVVLAPVTVAYEDLVAELDSVVMGRLFCEWEGRDLFAESLGYEGLISRPNNGQPDGEHDAVVEANAIGRYPEGGGWFFLQRPVGANGPWTLDEVRGLGLRLKMTDDFEVQLSPSRLERGIVFFETVQIPCHRVTLRVPGARELAIDGTGIETVWVGLDDLRSGADFCSITLRPGDSAEVLVPVACSPYVARMWLDAKGRSVLGGIRVELPVMLGQVRPERTEIRLTPSWSGFHCLRSTFRGLAGTSDLAPYKATMHVIDTVAGELPEAALRWPVDGKSELPALPVLPQMPTVADRGKDHEDKALKRDLDAWQGYTKQFIAGLGAPLEIAGELTEIGWPKGFFRGPTTGRWPRWAYNRARHDMPFHFAIPSADAVRCRLAEQARDEDHERRIKSGELDYGDDEYRHQLPITPDQTSHIALPESAPLGGAWVLMTNDTGFAIFWLDHSKPVDTVVHFRPWSELGWYWMEK